MFHISNYRIDKSVCLGKGGFGQVFLGFDQYNQRIACKIMQYIYVNSQLQKNTFTLSENELNIMLRVQSQYLVNLKSYIKQDNQLYLFLEYCNGGDLRRHLQKFQIKYPYVQFQKRYEDFAEEVFFGLINSLKYLYAQNIIHRDIKLENILLSNDTIKLGDFGLAKVLFDVDSQYMTTIIGTPYYESPQLLQRRTYTSKTDVWSFGVLLIEIALNKYPFQGNTTQQLLNDIQQQLMDGKLLSRIMTIRSTLLRQIIQQMLVFDEENRISLKELLQIAEFHKVTPSLKVIQQPLTTVRNRKPDYQQYQKGFKFETKEPIRNTEDNMYNLNAIVFFVTIGIILIIISKGLI